MKTNYLSFFKLLTVTLYLLGGALSQAQIIPTGTYKIFSSAHNQLMTCDAATPHDARMSNPAVTDPYQLWQFEHQGSDIYKIVNLGNSKTLGIKDGWCGNFGDVWANFSNTDPNVNFKIIPGTVSGTYLFQIAFTTCNFGSSNSPVKAFDIDNGAVNGQI